ncbi:MAG: RNA polymerase subunit sigma, partial [Treponema sp.]|nr:RNA polymerase subunit sigma [Treponema sp.]
CEKSRAIRLPLNRANEIVQIEHARTALEGNYSEEQECVEVGKLLNLDPAHVRELVNISRDMVSLDMPLAESGGEASTIGDFVQDARYDEPDAQVISDALKADIDTVLDTLHPNEAKVLRLRYGLRGMKPLSLKEVGMRCHLTKERIRQIEKRALMRMRHPTRQRKLEAYVA